MEKYLRLKLWLQIKTRDINHIVTRLVLFKKICFIIFYSNKVYSRTIIVLKLCLSHRIRKYIYSKRSNMTMIKLENHISQEWPAEYYFCCWFGTIYRYWSLCQIKNKNYPIGEILRFPIKLCLYLATIQSNHIQFLMYLA